MSDPQILSDFDAKDTADDFATAQAYADAMAESVTDPFFQTRKGGWQRESDARRPSFVGYARTQDSLYYGIPGAASALEPGFYDCVSTSSGPGLKRVPIKTDDLIDLDDEVSVTLLGEFERFWAGIPEMRKRGLSVKRGLLLTGPPGSGKTSIVHRVCAQVIQRAGGVAIIVSDPKMAAASIQMMRSVEPERPVAMLYEDIDAMVQGGDRREADLLALLDGEMQIGNVVHIATTNYPEKLDRRLTNRPGRFDRITHVPPPTEKSRAKYFATRAPDCSERHADWVAASEGWSVAHMRELVMAVTVLKEDEAAVIKRLTEMRDKRWTADDEELPKAGF